MSMDLLLDTHAALWWWSDSDRLGSAARAAMSNPGVRVFFNAVSGYEIQQKNLRHPLFSRTRRRDSVGP